MCKIKETPNLTKMPNYKSYEGDINLTNGRSFSTTLEMYLGNIP